MFTIAGELENKLDSLAKERGIPTDELLNGLIEEWLEDLEDVQAAEEVLRAIREGRETVCSSQELERKLGL